VPASVGCRPPRPIFRHNRFRSVPVAHSHQHHVDAGRARHRRCRLRRKRLGRRSARELRRQHGDDSSQSGWLACQVWRDPRRQRPLRHDLGRLQHGRKADLAVANADANTISLLLGRGDGRFTRTDLAVTGNPRGLTAADMNNDGRPDLVYTGFTNNRVHILTGDGSGGSPSTGRSWAWRNGRRAWRPPISTRTDASISPWPTPTAAVAWRF
jgi:hypothetical protein